MSAKAARWVRGIPVRKRPGKCSDRGVVTQTVCKALASIARPVAFGALLAVLGGCGMSSLTSGHRQRLVRQQQVAADVGSVDQDKLLAAAKTETGSARRLRRCGLRLPPLPGVVARRLRHGLRVWPRRRRSGRHAPRRDHQDGARMQRGVRPRHREIRLLRPGAAGPEGPLRPRHPAGQRLRDGLQAPEARLRQHARRRRCRSRQSDRLLLGRARGDVYGPRGLPPGEFEVYVGFDRNIPGAG